MAIRSPKWLVIATLVALAPDTPGVFELWDNDEVVYVGSTRKKDATLRTELARELERSGEATHFSWEITYDAARREQELLAEFEDQHHRPPRLNSRG
ncbi:MAG TPA: hypothetical protein VM183_13730 [Burkholderiales bacterium]|nr:hypothetical protein [Burkholderiales bacterium]